MKQVLCIVGVILFSALLSLPSALGKDAAASEKQLLKEFESALNAKDKDALLLLVNWQGVSAENKSFYSDTFEDLITNQIKKVSLAPLPPDFQATNEFDGIRYTQNLTVIGMVDVQFTQEGNSTRIPYGRKGTNFYLAGTLEEELVASGANEKQLNISVLGIASSETDTFTGSFVFVKGGKEIKQQIKGIGNISTVVRGDYIKSCTVQKTSDKQPWIQLVIHDDGKKIYESKKIETTEPIIYERK